MTICRVRPVISRHGFDGRSTTRFRTTLGYLDMVPDHRWKRRPPTSRWSEICLLARFASSTGRSCLQWPRFTWKALHSNAGPRREPAQPLDNVAGPISPRGRCARGPVCRLAHLRWFMQKPAQRRTTIADDRRQCWLTSWANEGVSSPIVAIRVARANSARGLRQAPPRLACARSRPSRYRRLLEVDRRRRGTERPTLVGHGRTEPSGWTTRN